MGAQCDRDVGHPPEGPICSCSLTWTSAIVACHLSFSPTPSPPLLALSIQGKAKGRVAVRATLVLGLRKQLDEDRLPPQLDDAVARLHALFQRGQARPGVRSLRFQSGLRHSKRRCRSDRWRFAGQRT